MSDIYMNILATMIAWVMVNGFPVATYESCEAAQHKATQLERENRDLVVTVDCDMDKPPAARQENVYYGPRMEDAREGKTTR